MGKYELRGWTCWAARLPRDTPEAANLIHACPSDTNQPCLIDKPSGETQGLFSLIDCRMKLAVSEMCTFLPNPAVFSQAGLSLGGGAGMGDGAQGGCRKFFCGHTCG